MPSIFRHSVLRPAGVIIINDPEVGREIQIDFLKCVHCQRCWQVEPGSGRRRGFCTRCNGVTCGTAACDECQGPAEQRIERYEQGKSPTF